MARGDMNYRNAPPKGDLPGDATRKQIMIEFGRRLQALLRARGMTQADLVNAARPHVPPGKVLAAYDVSNYIRGRSLPRDDKLAALAAALQMDPEALLPSRGLPEIAKSVSPLEMRQQEDGNVWLRLDRTVSYQTALKIMALLSEEDQFVSERSGVTKLVEKSDDGRSIVTRLTKEVTRQALIEAAGDESLLKTGWIFSPNPADLTEKEITNFAEEVIDPKWDKDTRAVAFRRLLVEHLNAQDTPAQPDRDELLASLYQSLSEDDAERSED